MWCWCYGWKWTSDRLTTEPSISPTSLLSAKPAVVTTTIRSCSLLLRVGFIQVRLKHLPSTEETNDLFCHFVWSKVYDHVLPDVFYINQFLPCQIQSVLQDVFCSRQYMRFKLNLSALHRNATTSILRFLSTHIFFYTFSCLFAFSFFFTCICAEEKWIGRNGDKIILGCANLFVFPKYQMLFFGSVYLHLRIIHKMFC